MIEGGGGAAYKRRPLSAAKGRRSSSSNILDAIPERVVSLRNKSPADKAIDRDSFDKVYLNSR